MRVTVTNVAVPLRGQVRDTSLVPVVARLVRAVEGVLDVEFDVTGPGCRTDGAHGGGPVGRSAVRRTDIPWSPEGGGCAPAGRWSGSPSNVRARTMERIRTHSIRGGDRDEHARSTPAR
nr:BON domain-containing protein [Streptomyces sp. TM32]